MASVYSTTIVGRGRRRRRRRRRRRLYYCVYQVTSELLVQHVCKKEHVNTYSLDTSGRHIERNSPSHGPPWIKPPLRRRGLGANLSSENS